MLLIDGNAGDGQGVSQDQLDLFGDNPSCATAELLIRLADQLGNTDVLLCESNAVRRGLLRDQFPNAPIICDHHEAPEHVTKDHVYALWLSDPCGPSEQGIEPMGRIAEQIRADFVATFNEGFLIRVNGTSSPIWAKSKEKYLPWLHPTWWTEKLGRRHMARTPLIRPPGSFHYRVLVISNYLTDAVRRRPFEVVL